MQAIEGTVTAAENGPIEGAIVAAQSFFSYCDTTDAAGHYFMEIFPDTYDMTVTAPGFNQFDTTGIVVLAGQTIQVNFALLHPEIVVEPASFDVELPVDTTYDATMTISNTGNGPLDFTISLLDGAGRCVKEKEVNQHNVAISHKISPDYSIVGLPQLITISEREKLEYGKGFSPLSSEEDTIHYDSENCGAIGVTGGGTFEGAIRLTPEELGPYDGWDIISVLFYYYTGDETGMVKIYGQGIPSSPGDLITSEPYSVSEHNWWRIDLSSSVSIDASQDIWVSLEASCADGEHPLGVDAGPAVEGKGDWYYWGGSWSELLDYGIDKNWNIRAIVLSPAWLFVTPDSDTVPADQSLDINLHFDTYGLTLDSTYIATIAIHNNSIDSLITIPVNLHTGIVGVEDEASQIPMVFALSHNYPNPFSIRGGSQCKSENPQTTISYSLPKSCKVSLKIYNIKGQLVETIVDDAQEPGYHSVVWNAEDISSGIYFYRITAGDFTDTKKCVILK